MSQSVLAKQYKFVQNIEDQVPFEWYVGEGGFAEELNHALRVDQKLTRDQERSYKGIMNAFQEIPPLEEDIMVYRGTSFLPFVVKSFISTSFDQKVAEQFVEQDCCLLEIIVPKGQKVLPLDKISMLPESEILLPPGRFTLVKKINEGRFLVEFHSDIIIYL